LSEPEPKPVVEVEPAAESEPVAEPAAEAEPTDENSHLFAVRTTGGQEKIVMRMLEARLKMGTVDLQSVLLLDDLKGYVVVESRDVSSMFNAIQGLRHVRGQLRGELGYNEIEKYLVKKSVVSELAVDNTVEIIGGPFKGMKATVTRVDKEKEEATVVLKKKTKLSDEGIKKLLAKTKKIQKETEELAERLATASADEVAEILKEAGGVSKADILALVEKKKQVDAIESSFLEKTMAKVYTRLVRDRELGVEEAFCINIEGILDHLLVEPSYFDTDKYSIDQYIGQIESSFRLLEPVLEQYPEIIVRLEGNADERGTVEYNKALSDRRWETPSRVLIALYFDEDRTAGIGRSEQCPLPRAGGVNTRDWWSKNRRTDYIFKLNE